jgi:hypothetical protein
MHWLTPFRPVPAQCQPARYGNGSEGTERCTVAASGGRFAVCASKQLADGKWWCKLTVTESGGVGGTDIVRSGRGRCGRQGVRREMGMQSA